MTPLSPAAYKCADTDARSVSSNSTDHVSVEDRVLASRRAAGTVGTSEAMSSSHSSGEQHPNTSACSELAARKEFWMLEQRIVAALVSVKPDPPANTSIIPGSSNYPFRLVPDSHKDIFSFSTSPELYGGVDVSFANPPSSGGDNEDSKTGDEAVAVYVIIDRRTMKVAYRGHEFFKLTVPYIPTFLAFREIAPLERLVQQQILNQPEVTPKAIFVDGNGILHPRHAGLACFLGVRTDIPTIGIGKSLFYEGGWTRQSVDDAVDEFVKDVHSTVGKDIHLARLLADYRGLLMKKVGHEADDQAENDDNDEDVQMKPAAYDRKGAIQQLAPFCSGMAVPLRNRKLKEALEDYDNEDEDVIRFSVLGCALVGHGGQVAASDHLPPRGGASKPIFVSVGHKISLQEATQVAASLSLYKIPEPVRQADLYGRQLMREREEESLKPVASKER